MLLRLSPSPANRPADFNPRSSCEERPLGSSFMRFAASFQSTLLMRGATTTPPKVTVSPAAFQSTLLMRGATSSCLRLSTSCLFQSTLLMRGATVKKGYSRNSIVFQSTLLMRGATNKCYLCRRAWDISIHAPHARSDVPADRLSVSSGLFQSTLLMRGATPIFVYATIGGTQFQSTLLMRGATLFLRPRTISPVISIHAPHARSDGCGVTLSRCA